MSTAATATAMPCTDKEVQKTPEYIAAGKGLTRLEGEIAVIRNPFYALCLGERMCPDFAVQIRAALKQRGEAIVQIATVHSFLALLGREFTRPSTIQYHLVEKEVVKGRNRETKERFKKEIQRVSFYAHWADSNIEIRIRNSEAVVQKKGGSVLGTLKVEADGPNEFAKLMRSHIASNTGAAALVRF